MIDIFAECIIKVFLNKTATFTTITLEAIYCIIIIVVGFLINYTFIIIFIDTVQYFSFLQLISIKYLEDKFYKSKSDVTSKLIERRREDVRDQMKELSNSKPQLLMNQEETIQEEARQRRAAEREVYKLVQLQYLIGIPRIYHKSCIDSIQNPICIIVGEEEAKTSTTSDITKWRKYQNY